MAKLYISEGGKEAVYELFDDSPEVTVGRGASNAIQIADGHASKVHFVLRRLRGRWKLVDLESKNGTRVNGSFQNAHWMAHNDTLTVGSVVLRFDAEGEPSGTPPRAAVAVAAAPAARAAGPAAPARPAPVAAPLAAVAAPAARASAAPAAPPRPPARAAASVPASSSRAPARRRSDDEDGEREERPRRPVKKGMPGAVIGLLMVLGAGVLVLIVSMLMSGEGANTAARRKAQKLRDQGQHQAALDLLKREAVPGGDGWLATEAEIKSLEAFLAAGALQARESEASRALDKEIKRWVKLGPSWSPADAIPEREAAQRLRDFFRRFNDTKFVRYVINAKDDTNAVYQRILRENPEEGRDDKKAWAEVEAAIATNVNTNRLGTAYAQLTFALQLERLNLSGAAYTTFEARVKERQEQLKENAKQLLQKTIADASAMARQGEGKVAKATVETILRILDWPDGDLKRIADEATRGW